MRSLSSRPVRAYNTSRLMCCLLFGSMLLTVATAPAVAQTGISYRSSATAHNGSAASSITVNKPSGTVTNDVMLATIFVRGLGTTPSVTAPSGWTLIRQDNIDGGLTAVMPSYYRVAGASEPANYTWTFDSSRLAVAVISSYSGVNTSAPIDAHNGHSTPTSSPITAPSVTTTVANAMLVGWFGLMEGGQNISPPTGMTERVETSPVDTNLTLEMSDELRATAGATGQRDATVSFEDNSVGQLIALKPVGGGANNPPTVSITSPANNATFTAPANITINASAEDSDGTITQVEFLQGTTSLSVDTSAPYSYAWNSVAAGSYTLTAKATDNAGATTTSAVVNVTVNASTGGSSGWTDTGANVILTDAADKVGIGVANPAFRLDVNGEVNATGLRINGEPIATGGTSQWTTSGASIYYTGNVGIGTTTPSNKLHVAGSITVDGNINAKYQDVAEWVESSQTLLPGTVVILDTNKSNQVVASIHRYDTRVAGVISALPGIALGEKGANKVLVATTGRVKIRVSTQNGPINIGDLLVTSDQPGVAMKSVAVDIGGILIHRPGTLIGKALERLSEGTGEILVLLSLQ